MNATRTAYLIHRNTFGILDFDAVYADRDYAQDKIVRLNESVSLESETWEIEEFAIAGDIADGVWLTYEMDYVDEIAYLDTIYASEAEALRSVELGNRECVHLDYQPGVDNED